MIWNSGHAEFCLFFKKKTFCGPLTVGQNNKHRSYRDLGSKTPKTRVGTAECDPGIRRWSQFCLFAFFCFFFLHVQIGVRTVRRERPEKETAVKKKGDVTVLMRRRKV